MGDHVHAEASAEHTERLLKNDPVSSETAAPELLSAGVATRVAGDVRQLTNQLRLADSFSRAAVVSRLQRGHGNAAVTGVLRPAVVQRAPAGTAVAASVRELSGKELVDFVRQFPDRVVYMSEANSLFEYGWQKGGGKGEVAAYQFVGEEATENIRVVGSRLSEGVRNEVIQTLRAHHGAKEAARARRAAAKVAERGAAGMADTPAAPSAVQQGPAAGPEAKGGSAEAKLGMAQTEVGGAEAKAVGVEAKAVKAESAAAKVEVRALSSEELVELVRKHPERVLLTELPEGEKLVFDNRWKKGGGQGHVAAFEELETKKIRVAPSRLEPAVREQVYQSVAAHAEASGEAAAGRKAAQQVAAKRAAGLAETPATPSAVEDLRAGGGQAKAGSTEAKLAGAETDVAGAQVKAAGRTGGNIAVAETQVAAVELKGLGADADVPKAFGKAAKVGRLARVGGLLLELGLPGPWDVFFMFLDAFGSIAEAKAKLRADAFALGFAEGLSATLVGSDPSVVMFRVATPSMGERVAGFEGVRERGNNEGVAAGFKFGEKLNPEQRSAFREKTFAEIKARNRTLMGDFGRDDLIEMGVALVPTVKKLLEEAARQEQERRESERLREEMRRSSRRRPGEV